MINKYSNVPLYAQLKDIIIHKIKTNEYAVNSQIPSEQELCEMYNISRPTVRQAINDLTTSGYLKKEKGKGTFVCGKNTVTEIKNYSGFQDSILDISTYANKQLISTEILPSSVLEKDILDKLNADINNYKQIAMIKYNLIENGELLALITSYIPVNHFPTIISDVLNNKIGQDILLGKYPLVPAKAKTCFEIIFADVKDCAALHIQSVNPIIKISNQIFSKNGLAVEYTISKYRIDRCKFLFELTRQ